MSSIIERKCIGPPRNVQESITTNCRLLSRVLHLSHQYNRTEPVNIQDVSWYSIRQTVMEQERMQGPESSGDLPALYPKTNMLRPTVLLLSMSDLCHLSTLRMLISPASRTSQGAKGQVPWHWAIVKKGAGTFLLIRFPVFFHMNKPSSTQLWQYISWSQNVPDHGAL